MSRLGSVRSGVAGWTPRLLDMVGMSNVENMAHQIMALDDSETVLLWIKETLEEAGYEVIIRSEAIGTGAAILRAKPDLVLIDVNMPHLDGDEVVTSLRKSAKGQETRIVLHSSLPLDELRARAARCGADGFCRKTKNKADFLRQVRLFLVGTGSPAGGSVLLITESSVQRSLAKLTLAEFPDLQVVTCDDDAQAMAQWRSRGGFSLVIVFAKVAATIMDYQTMQMARESGAAVIVFVSDEDQANTDTLAKSLGVTRVFAGPTSASALTAVIRQILKSPEHEDEKEGRRHRRPRLRIPVQVRIDEEPPFTATTWDINEQGAFLCTDSVRDVGATMSLTIELAHLKQPLQLSATVIHVRKEAMGFLPQGMGVCFTTSDSETKALLKSVFRIQ